MERWRGTVRRDASPKVGSTSQQHNRVVRERDNGLEGVIKRGRRREKESRKMMITLDSQQYGSAETEIMMEGETHRGKREREQGAENVNATQNEETRQ